ncbi:MAG: hypothetical protein HY293_19515 [Planctomycetes bacterium]|nr:hypothetical protein [Planctomycetota bacterium]
MSDSNSYGFGGKLIAAVVLALLCGYLWACFEEGKNPLAILRIFSGPEEPEAKKAPPPAKEIAKAPPAPAPKVEAPKVAPAPKVEAPKIAPAPAGPKMYSAIDMSILFNETDDLLRRGKLFEARDRVQNTSRLMIPQDSLAKFTDYETRVSRYHSLLLETTKGGTIEMPKMTQILIRGGGKLVVKVLSEDRDSITYETLTGIRSKIEKARTDEIKTLEPVYGRVEVSLELKKQADYKGMIVEQEPGKPLSLREKPGRKAGSLQIFDLADFCARNGANDKLVPLFDEALARDPDLLNTVHEAKAERMVDVLVYFLSIKATYDARKTLEILKDRYVESKAYKDRVSGDAEFVTNMDMALNRRSSAPIAKLDTKPSPSPAPAPAPKAIEIPGLPPAEKPSTPPPSAPPAPKPAEPAEAPIRVTDPERPIDVTSVTMPEGTSAKIAELVARGDKFFREAMDHLNNCDPRIKPESAADENKKALKAFLAANECYVPAQDLYKDVRVPEALLDRVRDCTQRAYFCRKFAVAARK